jgi:acyl-CoA thioester hydrolase
MLINKTTFRVRYGETDQMGIVNNAVYPSWFEVGRTELFRDLNLPYSEMEKNGIMLPLVELHVKYHAPSRYEDLVTLTTEVKQMPAVRILFEYEIHNSDGQKIASGETTHAFIDATSRRPIRMPEYLKEQLKVYFNDNERNG